MYNVSCICFNKCLCFSYYMAGCFWTDLVVYQKKYFYEQYPRFYGLFPSRILMILGLTFKSLIHFEFILVCGVRRRSSFIFLHVSVQFSQHHLLNKLSLAHCMCLLPLSNINYYEVVSLFLSSLLCSLDLCVCFYASTMLF